MPIVTITLIEGKEPAFISALSQIVHTAMVETIQCPPATLYHIINEVKRDRLIFLREYKGLKRSDDVVILQITLKEGRTPEQKKMLYERISRDAHDQLGVRKENLWIILTDNKPEDWYFGSASG